MNLTRFAFLFVTSQLVAVVPIEAAADEIEIAQLERSEPVDFNRELLPILRRSCLACHNESDAESDLVLESPESILAGGATGEVVIPGEPEKSFLLQVSAHREEPVMPPGDNSVEAPNLTPSELGLMRLWILQGAKASSSSSKSVEFEPLPPGLNPVYAIALSADSQILVAGRANQVSIHHLASQRELARLTDPKLLEMGLYSNPGVAHLDLVQSIAISPNGRRLATGGFRTVKLWNQEPIRVVAQTGIPQAITASVALPEMSAIALGNESGQIYLLDATDGKAIQFWAAHDGPVTAIASLKDGGLLSCGEDRQIRHWRFAKDAPLPSLLRGGSVDVAQPITAICVSDDGATFIVATADFKLHLWPTTSVQKGTTTNSTIANPAPIRSWDGHDQTIRLIRIVSEDLKQVVTGSDDGKLRLWGYSDGQQIQQFDHAGPVANVIAVDGGSKLVSCGADQSIKVWDVANGSKLLELQGDTSLERALAAAELHQRLKLRLFELAKADLDAGNKRKAAEDENLKKAKEALAAGNKDLIAKKTALEEAQMAFENAREIVAKSKNEIGECEQAVALAKERIAEAKPQQADADVKRQQLSVELTKSKDRYLLALAELAKHRASVAENPQDLERLKLLQESLNQVAELTSEQVTRVGEQKAADQAYQSLVDMIASFEAELKSTEERLAAVQQALPAAEKMLNDTKAATDAASQAVEASTRNLDSLQRAVARAEQAVNLATQAIPGLKELVTTAEAVMQEAQKQHAEAQTAKESASQVFAGIAYSVNDGFLYSLTNTGRLQSWDLSSGTSIDTVAIPFEEHDGQAPTAANILHINDQQLAVVAGSKVTLIDLGGGWVLTHQIGSPDGESPFTDRVTALDFHPNGELLAVGCGEPSRSGQISLLNSQTGAVLRSIDQPHSDTVWSVRFSPDGKRLASGGADRFMKVFDVASGELVRGFEGHTHHVLGVAWSADGRRLASSGADKSVKIWDALTGEQQRTIGGFRKEATAVRFVGLENQVLVSSGDQSVQIKRGDNGGNVRAFGGFSDFVHCVDISADGRTIAAGGQDSIVRIWSNDGQQLAELRGEPEIETSSRDSKSD